MKTNWIKFKTWTNLEAAYCFNEASEYFDEVIYPQL